MANILASIDDTDAPGTAGTGELLEDIMAILESRGLGRPTFVTRHQLLVHPDIPYTSHNSSMAIEIKDAGPEGEIYSLLVEEVCSGMAHGSDPGICVVNPELLSKSDSNRISEFGKRAKREILTKDEAYSLASETGVKLSEHGGTGDGIIGAFAGIGLRLTGNDGRVKGKFKLETENGLTTIANLFECGRIDRVIIEGNAIYDESDIVSLTGAIKTVFQDGKRVLPLISSDIDDSKWRTLSKQEIKEQY